MIKALNGASEPGRLKCFLHDVCASLTSPCAIYWELDAETNVLEQRVYIAEPLSAAAIFVQECTAESMIVADSYPSRALTTGGPVHVDLSNSSTNVRLVAAAESEFACAVALPVSNRSRTIGLLELFFSKVASVPSDDFLKTLAFHTGVLLDLSLKEVELRENEMLFRQMSSNIQALAATVKEAARKERAIIEQALDVICSLEHDLTIIKVNPACINLFGRSPNDMTGQSMRDFISAQTLQWTLQQFELAREQSRGQKFENSILDLSGKLVDVSWSVQWAEAESSFFCVARNISELKEIERLKQQFVAMISHDIRTPLMSVGAVLSAVSEGVYGTLVPRGLKRTAEAQSSLAFVVQLVNSILELEQLGSGKLMLEMSRARLDSLVETALRNVAPLAEARSISLKCNVEPLVEVLGDETRLIQVIVNLLGNAIKYSPPEDTVEVALLRLSENMAELRVCDHGRGIPGEFRESIFDRFRQVERSDATERGGVGLGLAICKEIVELHRGTIGVDNNEGGGSVFWIRIPSVPVDESHEASALEQRKP